VHHSSDAVHWRAEVKVIIVTMMLLCYRLSVSCES